MVALLVICLISGLWSAIGGPSFVAHEHREKPEAQYPVHLYIVRAIPLGLAVAVLSALELAERPVPGLAVVLLISAIVQAADSVIGFRARNWVLGPGAAVFAIVQLWTAILLF